MSAGGAGTQRPARAFHRCDLVHSLVVCASSIVPSPRFLRQGLRQGVMPAKNAFIRAGRYDIARAVERWGGLYEVRAAAAARGWVECG